MAKKKFAEKFAYVFNFTRTFSEFCGADVIKDNYKICWKTVAVFLLVNSSIVFILFNFYKEVIVSRNYAIGLKTGAILGTAFQAYTKMVNGIIKQKNFRFLYNEIYQMYEIYEAKSRSYDKCLSHNISLVKKLLITVFATVLLTAIFVIGVPVYLLVVLKERNDVLPLQFPFVDKESGFGFYFTFVMQIVYVLFGLFGNFVVDSWLFVYAAHIPLLKSILKCKFEDLDVILEADPADVDKASDSLNDIFKWHQKYILFCDIIRKSFFWVIFVQISTEFFGIISSIVSMFLGTWPLAPVVFFYLYSLVLSYCSLGNLVEVANDDVTEMIYDSHWYHLSIPEQKMIIIMLRESQQATGLSIGGVAALSLNTALQLTKTIYTMSMMLKESLH